MSEAIDKEGMQAYTILPFQNWRIGEDAWGRWSVWRVIFRNGAWLRTKREFGPLYQEDAMRKARDTAAAKGLLFIHPDSGEKITHRTSTPPWAPQHRKEYRE